MANNLTQWKSTAIGAILFLLGIIFTVVEYFTVEVIEWQHYIFPAVLTAMGIGFLLAPDRLVDFLFSWAKKKTGA